MRICIQLPTIGIILLACAVARGQCSGGFCRPAERWVIAASPTPALDSQHSTLDSSAHCRIHVGDGTVGSGTLISKNDETGLVLTCSHLFDAATSSIIVEFPNGRRFGGRLIDRDPANDLAAVLIQRPDTEPLSVDDGEPTGVLTACGYGGNGNFRPASGPISGAVQAVGATFPSLKIASAVRPGDSGGGVLDRAGRLVGVVWGCRDGETYLTCGRPLREFLIRVLRGTPDSEPGRPRPRLPAPTSTQLPGEPRLKLASPRWTPRNKIAATTSKSATSTPTPRPLTLDRPSQRPSKFRQVASNRSALPSSNASNSVPAKHNLAYSPGCPSAKWLPARWD